MMSNTDIVQQEPPRINHSNKGRKPVLLNDNVVIVLLANTNVWFRIGVTDNWISGVKKNIESMQQNNIKHLIDVGRFSIVQRKNDDTNKIDIYCQFVTSSQEEE